MRSALRGYKETGKIVKKWENLLMIWQFLCIMYSCSIGMVYKEYFYKTETAVCKDTDTRNHSFLFLKSIREGNLWKLLTIL